MYNDLSEITPEQSQAHNKKVLENPADYPPSAVEAAKAEMGAQKERDDLSAEVQSKTNEDGSPKTTYETQDPKKFGVKENLEDAGRAVVTGLQNAWNNTVDLGKYFDAEFYEQRNVGEDPYEFASNIKFNGQLMPRTRWGKFLRDVTDFGVGMVGVGKIGMGIKGLRGVMMAGKTVDKAGKVVNVAGKTAMAKRLGADAVKGAFVDVWDSTVIEDEGIAESLIKANPVFAQNLLQLEDGRDVSPAQRAFLNVFESMGIGAGAGAALEAAGVGYRKLKGLPSTEVTKPTENIADSLSTINKSLSKSEAAEYQAKVVRVTGMAKTDYEAQYFKSLKRKGVIDEDITIKEWRETWKNPSKVTPETESWYRPAWEQLDDRVQQDLFIDMAFKKGIDAGEIRNYSKFATKQGNQYLDIGADQLNVDLDKGVPREGAYYRADKTDTSNFPLSSGSSVPLKALRDQTDIRSNFGSKWGSTRGTLTSAQIHKMAETSGVDVDIIQQQAKALFQNDEYKNLYKGASSEELADDMIVAATQLQEFITPNGRASNFTSDQLLDFIYAFDDDAADYIGAGKGSKGVRALTQAQIQMTDVVLGQLSQEMRDISRAALSVDGVIDSKAPGEMLDEIAVRYKALQGMRQQTTSLIANRLREFRAPGMGPKPGSKAALEIAAEAKKRAAAQTDLLIQVIREDESGELFEAFRYFTAASNGNLMTMADMDEFFAKRLKGYSGPSGFQRNKVVGELMTMGINSMLSGPKTPVRAIVGTGINTMMRPAAAIVGATFTGDRKTKMAALSQIGGLLESIPEAWRKAVADFNTYFDNGGDFRGYTAVQARDEFEAMANHYATRGTDGEKAQFAIYKMLHGLNQVPFLSYGPRIMKSADSFFGQMIARGNARSAAFNEVYDRMVTAGGAVGDLEMKTAIREAEKRFTKKIWRSNGELADEYANFQWKEAALTGDLPAYAQKIQAGLEMLPAIKPFVGLFMKTGVNALQLTGKYTPILNRFLQESSDIMTKEAGHPDLLRYGIRTADELAQARAVLRGREAIGAGMVTLAGSLYLGGNLTGNGPPDQKLRKAWEQTGRWQARSIKVGDKWVSYESLEPFNAFLAAVADIGDAQGVMGEQFTEDRLGQLQYLIAANVTNKTFLAGLMNLGDLMSGKGQSPGAVAANLVNNQIPLSSLRNEIGKAFNPGMRELEGSFKEQIRNRNLWAEFMVGKDGRLPYRYDIFTGEPLSDWDPMTNMINRLLPFRISKIGSQAREMIFRSGVNLNQTFTTTPDGLSLKEYPDVISRFQFLISQQNLEQQFEQLFKDPSVLKSILDMERDHANGITLSPNDTAHGIQIKRIFRTAKLNAWAQLQAEDATVGRIAEEAHLKKLETRARKKGDTNRAAELDRLQNIPK